MAGGVRKARPVVVAATMPESLDEVQDELTRIADRASFYVGGAGASGTELDRWSPLPDSPVEAARVVEVKRKILHSPHRPSDSVARELAARPYALFALVAG